MVEQYLRFLKKKYNVSDKKATLLGIIKEQDVDLNSLTEQGSLLLNLVIMEEDIDLLKLLLKMPDDYKSKSANPNLIDSKLGWSPLVTAINQGPSGNQDSIFELLRAHADPNLVVQQNTLIMWAARCNQYETIKILQKYGGDLNLTTEKGSAMHQACALDNLETVEYLLEQQVNLGKQDENGDSALHICAINGSNNSLMTIIKHYNRMIEEEDDQEVVYTYTELYRRILNLQNNQGNTLLHECASNERQTLIEKIRRIGLADESIRNKEGKTAREIENQIKEELFKEQISKQKQITESRERKKQIQLEKQQRDALLQKEEEEEMEKERKQQKEQMMRDPVKDNQRFRMFAAIFFILILALMYYILDMVAKNNEKVKPGSMRRTNKDF